MKTYRFSRHAKERWKERFPWKVKARGGDITNSLAEEFYKRTSLDASFKNDTKFMVYLGDTYGWEGGDWEFYVSDDAVFLCREDTLITVYRRSGSRFQTTSGRFRR